MLELSNFGKWKERETYVCSKIDKRQTASEIVKSVNLLIAIQWGKQAWAGFNQLPASTASSLVITTPRTSRIYFLLKIHKPNNPGRPIVPACSCPTKLISILLDKVVAPVVRSLPSYIKDSRHALQNFTRFQFPGRRQTYCRCGHYIYLAEQVLVSLRSNCRYPFFTFSCKISLPESSCQISIYYGH